MNHQEFQPESRQTMMDKGLQEVWEAVVMLPPTTVMVFLRQNVGYRLLKPMGLLTLILLFAFLTSVPWTPLMMFGTIALIFGTFQRVKRWFDGHRGVKNHSYYLGDSIFNALPVGNFVRRHRLMGRFFDPAVCCGIGYWLTEYAPRTADGLGIWLFVSGFFLLFVEFRTYRLQFVRDMDMVDGVVYSEYQGGKVDNFEDSQPETPKHQQLSDGLATGLGADISDKVRQRRRGR